MSEFDYLIDKIDSATFCEEPFTHINILDFFNKEHFGKIIAEEQILRGKFDSVEEMIDDLLNQEYKPQHFPGCITSIEKYIKFINNPDVFNRKLIKGYGRNTIEGYGLTMRLQKYRSDFLSKLIEFLNGDRFKQCIMNKFDVSGDVDIETAIQKNLSGYEISPHCDTRRKALTYMINIYTSADSELASIHTHLLKFKPERKYLYDFWRYNKDIDTCWVPWSWCETVKETTFNNSIIIFKPGFDTLHGVKLAYDHLAYQRNQIYGNLWYQENHHRYTGSYKMVDIVSPFTSQGARGFRPMISRLLRGVLEKL